MCMYNIYVYDISLSLSLLSYRVTPRFIVQAPCLYAQLKTVITFHY